MITAGKEFQKDDKSENKEGGGFFGDQSIGQRKITKGKNRKGRKKGKPRQVPG